MTKARDLANLIAAGNPLADGAIAASEVSGLATVATSGAYANLTGTPTLGTASALDVGTGANSIVQLDGSGNLPAVSGANLTGLSSSGNLFTAPADGSVTNGDMLILRSDGDVAKVAVESVNFPFDVSNSAVSVEVASEYTTLERTKIAVNKADPTKFCIIGKTDNGRGYAAAGSVSSGTVTITNAAIFHSDFFEGDVCHIEGNYWCFAFRSSNEYGRIRAWDSTGSNNGGSLKSLYTFSSNSTYRIAIDSPKSGGTDDNLIALIWMDNNDGNEGHALVANFNSSNGNLGDTGTSYHVEWSGSDSINGQNDLFFDHVNGQTQGIIVFNNDTNSVVKLMPFKYQSSTFSYGSEVTTGVRARDNGVGFRNIAIAYNENQPGIFVVAIVAHSTHYLHVIPFTFSEGSSGNLPSSITKGTAIVGNEDLGETTCDVFLSGNTTNVGGVMFYNGYSKKVQVRPFTISSNVITAGTTQDIVTNSGSTNDEWRSVAAVDANNNFEFYGFYSTDGADQFVESFTLGRTVTTTSLSSSPFVGVAQNSASSGQTVTVMTKGGIDDAQSGLSIGTKYFIQDNGTLGTSAGTVSTVAGVALTSSTLLIGD